MSKNDLIPTFCRNDNLRSKRTFSATRKREEEEMLFMAIASWEPEKRNEIIKRRQERGAIQPPKGAKLLGEWNVIGGGKVFRLIDVEDPKAGFAAALAWSDLCQIEIIPVIETEEAMKLIPKK